MLLTESLVKMGKWSEGDRIFSVVLATSDKYATFRAGASSAWKSNNCRIIIN